MVGRSSLAALLLLTAVAGCGGDAHDARPNVLLISLDSVRRDMVGAYGASFPHASGRSPSPNLDRLAREGAVIEDVRSTTSWTLPAHLSLFTGVVEFVHGVEQDGQRLDDGLPTLAERLRGAGYRTFGVYSGPYLDPRFGCGRGFERYDAGYGPDLARAARAAADAHERVQTNERPALEGEVLKTNARAQLALEKASHRDQSSKTVTDAVLAELAAAADDERPFFVFAHYFDPHYDYVPPPPHDRDFDPDYRGEMDGQGFARRMAAPSVAPRDLEHLRALHAGELAWTDAEIGRVLAELERLGLAQDTLVIVSADHGDEFLEHGALGHRRGLYEEVLRIPLLLWMPGRIPASERVPGLRSLADVAPTVLSLTGVAPGPAPLLAPDAARTGLLGRLVVNPTGERADVRVIEGFWHGPLKLLRERALAPDSPEFLRWIDLERHPDEAQDAWSSDFSEPRAREALEAFRGEYARLARERRAPVHTTEADDLLAAFRGLGYVGEEARVGGLAADELVLPLPGEGLIDASKSSGD